MLLPERYGIRLVDLAYPVSVCAFPQIYKIISGRQQHFCNTTSPLPLSANSKMRRRLYGEAPWDTGNNCATSREDCWMFFVPEKKQRMRMPVLDLDGDMEPSDFCTYHLSFDAFKLLCNSMEEVKIGSDEGLLLLSAHSTLKPLQGQNRLEMLPAELLEAIFGFLEAEEFMALALCSQTLWFHAIGWIKGSYTRWKNEYSWVNTPIICTTRRLRILPKALQHILPESTPDDMERESKQIGYRYKIATTRASIWFDKSVDNYDKVPFPYDCTYEEAFLKQLERTDIPESLYLIMKACFPSIRLEPGSSWLLRNLTDQEYIRMEAVVTSDGEPTISLPGCQWLTLDILLLWLISWRVDYTNNRNKAWSWEQLEAFEGFTDQDLSDVSLGPPYGPMCSDFWPIWAGPWAGHRLDVVAETGLDNDWKDRTENITRLAPKMLRVFYGRSLEIQKENRDYWEEAFRKGGDHWEFRQSSPVPWEFPELAGDKPKQRLSRIR
ncbi:uncharacterized protein FMAN_11620 [Fusarium mangiferae]|uniref:F-box domain-containing protein n=1 Tax=Fusarium mangiferae TaxID=192010 RepID=A0A1L7TI78_FUSMA|nr:uncharacterized protein FMAN_11620 [Fusarium mangiferae]CVK97619.1 uncharacterized protein FMAN_11620 [Fusarium mangiferae]